MNEQVESGVTSGESGGEQVSEEGRDEQTSRSELEERIVGYINQEVERRFQSAKDKRWAELEKQYGSLQELSEKVESKETEALYEKSLEETIKSFSTTFVEQAGLGEDPEALALLEREVKGKDLDSYFKLLGDVTALIVKRAGRGKVTAAAVVQPGSGNAPVGDLREGYERRKKRLRPGDVNGLMALKREFREKGLDVY